MLNKVNKYTREKSFDPEVVGAVSKVLTLTLTLARTRTRTRILTLMPQCPDGPNAPMSQCPHCPNAQMSHCVGQITFP